MPRPLILGIVNITADSFSDGGRFLAPDAALGHARALRDGGADIIDLGPAASNPDAQAVGATEEIRRLSAVAPSLIADGVPLSVDSFEPETQLWALGQGVAYLNDIHGFGEPAIYPQLARASARLIVMHSVQGRGLATRVDISPAEIMERVFTFFDARLAALTAAGIARERLILDPGMGFFLGTDPETSFTVLRRLPDLVARYRLPLLVSVSRKSFLRRLTGRAAGDSGPATLAAELCAASQGAAFLRTHDPAALRDALTVVAAFAAR